MNQGRVKRLILTASLFYPTRNGLGLSRIDFSNWSLPLLWVHHAADPCPVTPYAMAKRIAEQGAWPLITVHGGGPSQGDACKAMTAHGFVGIENETVAAMKHWLKTGQVVTEVGRE